MRVSLLLVQKFSNARFIHNNVLDAEAEFRWSITWHVRAFSWGQLHWFEMIGFVLLSVVGVQIEPLPREKKSRSNLLYRFPVKREYSRSIVHVILA